MGVRRIVWVGLLVVGSAWGQAMPAALVGSWRVEKVIASGRTACWDAGRAKDLVGSTLRYGPGLMEWKGGTFPVQEAYSRGLSRKDYLAEYKVDLGELGIRAERVTEVDLQHEDADITGATTEVPGDTVLLAGPRRIVVSACGVYFSAVRMGH